jgi:hypothetical protein
MFVRGKSQGPNIGTTNPRHENIWRAAGQSFFVSPL